MKTLKNTGLSLLAAIAFMAIAATNTVKAQPGMSVSFQLFYDELAPYGEWIDDPEYGYIWLPDAERDFQPYATNGNWVMTTYGNTWVSDYPWGWAPFHYGRWTYTDYYGWAWIPGYEWGPAWVSWRSGGGYYGWAPLAPRMSINVHVGIPHHHWVFVPQRYICSPRLYSYYAPHRNRVNIYNRTTIINNTYVYNNRTYVSGPRRSDIERATGSRVAVREINNSSRPGRAAVNNRAVSIYRPDVDRNSRTSARPSRVADAASVRSAGTRGNSRAEATRTSSANRNTSATRGETSRNTEAGRSRTSNDRSNDAVRPTGSARSRGNVSTPERQTERGRATAPRTNSERGSSSTRKAADRPETVTRQSRAASSSREAARPSAYENKRSSSSTSRSAPARSNDRVSSQRQTSSPSRSSSVKSSSRESRPAVSTSRGSEKSRSSATLGKTSERNNSSGRGRG